MAALGFPLVSPLGGEAASTGGAFIPPRNVTPQYQPAGADAPTLGADISALPDLDPTFTLYSGAKVLGEALVRRLQTRRGGLFYAPAYGKDLRQYLNATVSKATLMTIKNDIEREAENDDRISTAVAAVEYNTSTQTITALVQVYTADGPFRFVLSVDQLGATTFRAG